MALRYNPRMPTQAQRIRIRRTKSQRERAAVATMRRAASIHDAIDSRIASRDAAREAARAKPRRTQEPSDMLVVRGVLSPAQAEAGERMWRDWYASRSEQRVTARYERSTPGHDDPAERVVAARERFECAVLAVPIAARSLVEHVFVVPRLSLSQWGNYMSMRSTRQAEVAELLRTGLDALRRHYSGGGA